MCERDDLTLKAHIRTNQCEKVKTKKNASSENPKRCDKNKQTDMHTYTKKKNIKQARQVEGKKNIDQEKGRDRVQSKATTQRGVRVSALKK